MAHVNTLFEHCLIRERLTLEELLNLVEEAVDDAEAAEIPSNEMIRDEVK